MLERPDVDEEKIAACLREEYGLSVGEIAFLPLGADLNTAVYRVAAEDGDRYFLKLRRGEFDEAGVAVPRYLSDLGIRQVIPPLATRTGQLRAGLPPFAVILYPYVDGRNGYERKLTPQQWIEFGSALRRFHAAAVPAPITVGTPREAFSPRWRERLEAYLRRIDEETFHEPVAAELAGCLKGKRDELLELVERAGQLAKALGKRPLEYTLCHGDIHGWNLLTDAGGALYMVDWDTLIFAPKERDLMFIGGGLGESGHTPDEEEALFYRGYGAVEIDREALAYYRYERIVEDLAVFCEQILDSDEGGEDRRQSLEYVRSNFLPGGTIAVACRSDPAPADRGAKRIRKAVLFDLYGTLVELQIDEESPRFWSALAADFHWPGSVSGEALKGAWTRRVREASAHLGEGFILDTVFSGLLEEFGASPTPENAGLLARRFRKHSITHLGRKEYADRLLDAIKGSGCKLGLVSNTEALLTAHDLDALGLDGRFDAVVLSSSAGVKKPDRRIFEIALARLGAAPEECAFVGDTFADDIAGASNAGIDAVFLTTSAGILPDCGNERGGRVVCAGFELGEIVGALHRLGFDILLPGEAPGSRLR